MSDLLQSYRSLPAGQRAVVGGVAVIVAIVLLVNLPHILGALISAGLVLLVLGFWVLAVAALIFVVYAVVKAIGSRP